MSLLWRNHLRIGLCPDRLIVAGYCRSLRQHEAHKDIVPTRGEAALDEPGSDYARWHAAVEALPLALAQSDPQKLEVTVILSNHFVRYALLPWNAELKSEEEWQSLAHHRLGSVYGPNVEDWALQQSKTSPEGARVVCAADRPMLEALSQKISACGATLVSVQPYLMSAFNRVRTRIGNECCWLVLEERGRLTLVLFRRGSWQAIRSRRVDCSWTSQLPEILEREQAILGVEEPCTQAFVYSESEIDSWSAGTYRFVDLTLASDAAEGDRAFAMALG